MRAYRRAALRTRAEFAGGITRAAPIIPRRLIPNPACRTLVAMLVSRMTLIALLAATACDPAEADDGGSESAGAELPTGGNFPDTALALCGPLPDGVVAIDDLASAHAATGPRPSGSDTDATAVRLRLSSWGVDADEGFPSRSPSDPACKPGWAVAFDLSAPAVGTLDIATIAGEWETDEIDAGVDGKCFSGGGEVGGDGQLEVVGTLEIFAVTDTCIVGELSGIAPGTAGLHDGGFAAVRAELPCVPTNRDCG